MKIKDFLIETKDDQIPWRLFTPDGSTNEYCVLWLQGWTSSMDSHREGVERMAKQTGVAFATMDYAGHGLHKLPLEESSRKLQHQEVLAIFDEVKKRGFEKIIVIGGSFGGYMAALLTSSRSVHTAVLRAPAMYPDDEFELAHKLTVRWKNPDRGQQDKADDPYVADNAAGRSVAEFDGFTYVLEHELDEQVPKIMPQTYFRNAKKGNYLIVPKTMHSPKLMSDPRRHYAYIEHLLTSIIEAVKLQDKL